MAIQVCKELTQKNADRETRALKNIAGELQIRECMIITENEEKNLDLNGISVSVIPFWKWLLTDSPGENELRSDVFNIP